MTNAAGNKELKDAELVLARIVQHTKRTRAIDACEGDCRWQSTFGRPVFGQTVSLVGLVAINERIARLVKAFGMRAVAYRRRTRDTRKVVDAYRIDHLGERVLDVFDGEPLSVSSLSWDVPTVYLCAHCSNFAGASISHVIDLVRDRLSRYRAGEPLRNEVDPHLATDPNGAPMDPTTEPAHHPAPVAVVTGGASGIGAAMVERLVSRGFAIAIADLSDELVKARADAVNAAGGRAIGIRTDVADEASVKELADQVLNELGVPELVCNNAGVNAYGFRTWEVPVETWRWILDVNLMGVVHGISAFVPHMIKADRGRIINTASVLGLASAGEAAPYAASKHAVVAISESLRFELAAAESAVGVSVVCPGLIATGIGNSARHWPDRLGAPAALGPAGEAYAEKLETARAAAPGPELVADAVLEAIDSDRFLVFPDEDTAEGALKSRTGIFNESRDVAPGSSWF